MNSLRYRIITMTIFTALVASALAETTHAQASRSLRSSAKSKLAKPMRPMSRLAHRLPDWWIEVPEEGPPKFGLPGNDRISISPVPTPIPHPGQRRSRSGFNPVSFPPLFDELLEMYADAVRRGDLGAADLIEELIIIIPDF
jgi:hypothetical protein